MEVDTVNIFGADAWKGRHWGGGWSSRRGSCLKLHEDSPHGRWRWALATGPSCDYFSHSGLQPITMPGNQVKMKSMFGQENRAGGEESGWTDSPGQNPLAELGCLGAAGTIQRLPRSTLSCHRHPHGRGMEHLTSTRSIACSWL